MLHIAVGPGALAFGDGIVNYGELGHPPDQLLGDDPEAVKADIVDGLVPLLDEDFDVLCSRTESPSRAAARRCCASSSIPGDSTGAVVAGGSARE